MTITEHKRLAKQAEGIMLVEDADGVQNILTIMRDGRLLFNNVEAEHSDECKHAFMEALV